MTETEPIPDLATEVRTALRLLVEYTDKLRQWVEQVRPIIHPTGVAFIGGQDRRQQLDDLTDRFERIRPACLDLSRMASGLIEQSRADFPQRTELRLRLAEFENALVTLGKLLAPEPAPRGKK